MPTAQPFLYTVSVTVTEGTPIPSAEAVLLEEIDRIQGGGITEVELAKAKTQLRARLVFDGDSVTNIAHQLGYFETIDSVDLFPTELPRIAAVTAEQVAAAAQRVLASSNRTIGWFDPLPAA
jgi:predicted Zn-dependent peptidase